MKIKELQTLLDSQPSVSGSTFLVGSLYVLSWILATAFLVLGIGLLLEGFLGFRIFLDWVSKQINLILDESQRTQIATSFGTICLLLSAVFTGVIFLSKMVLKRNHYMIQMEDWIYANLTEIKKTTRKKTVR